MQVTTREGNVGTALSVDVGLKVAVVATDFSRFGEQAVWRSAQLQLAPDATLVLTHVLPGRFDKTVDSLIRSAAERELDRAAARIGDRLVEGGRSDIRVRVRLVRGSPAAAITEVAEANGAELVAVGRRGHNPLRELLIGSTASNLLRHGRFPILIATDSPRMGFAEVIVGYDQSATALAAARLAKRLLPRGVAIRVVHAFEDEWRGLPPAFVVDASALPLGTSLEPLERRAEEVQDAMERVWPRDDFQVVIEEADPRKLLLDVARESGADLIVMGSRGLSGFARVALGSVAEAVLHRTEADMLIVPAPR